VGFIQFSSHVCACIALHIGYEKWRKLVTLVFKNCLKGLSELAIVYKHVSIPCLGQHLISTQGKCHIFQWQCRWNIYQLFTVACTIMNDGWSLEFRSFTATDDWLHGITIVDVGSKSRHEFKILSIITRCHGNLTPMTCWDLQETHAMYLNVFQVIMMCFVLLKFVYIS